MSEINYEPFDLTTDVRDYKTYERLREEAPVFRSKAGYWVISRYDDVSQILNDSKAEYFSASANQDEGTGVPTDVDPLKNPEYFARLQAITAGMDVDVDELLTGRQLVASDPPGHTRLRRVAAKAFSPRQAKTLAGDIEAIVDECLEGIKGQDKWDLVEELAAPMPINVIAALLGVDESRRDDIRRWSDEQARFALSPDRGSEEAQLGLVKMMREVSDYFVPLIQERRQNPQNDLISVLASAQAEDRLTETELVLFALSIFTAGNTTTRHFLGNLVVLLLEYPDQLEILRERPDELLDAAVDEAMRFRSPLQMIFRKTVQDVEIGGVTIPGGENVIGLVASANRDPRQFEEPERFDITRAERSRIPHLAFGAGIHYCIGIHLAKLELRIALQKLLPYLDDFELDTDDLELEQLPPFWGYPKIQLVAKSGKEVVNV